MDGPGAGENAVAGNARHSSGVTLVGIDPLSEAKISFFGTAVSQGRYLNPDDRNGIVIGQALMKNFDTRSGHKLVLMFQDTHGEIASRAFRIVGIFRAEMEATEKQFAFVILLWPAVVLISRLWRPVRNTPA